MLADLLPIVPFTAPVDAMVRLPGSKSITNRAMLLAALSSGETTITGALFSDDTAIMADGLRRLGFSVSENAATAEIRVQGRGGETPATSAELFVGLAGTAARFLTALCCLAPKGKFKIDGVPQMRKRPIKGLLDALELLGAHIKSDHGFFPIEIEACGLHGGEVSLDATESSQLLSALLMVAPLASGAVVVRLTDPGYRREYVTMTLEMMEQFGQPASAMSSDGLLVRPPWRSHYGRTSEPYAVEPDASAASYFLALPLVVGGSVRLPGLRRPSLQGDAAFAERLAKAGAQIEQTAEGISCLVDASTRPGTAIDDNFHAISDTFLTLAAIAPLLRGVTRISGIAHTRKQETDRVAGMARELAKLGQHVVETEDALEIHPRQLQPDVAIETYGDHRFAMSFAVLGCHDLHGDGRPWLSIKNPGVCAKTFPTFFETLEQARRDSSTHQMSTAQLLIIAIDGGAASGKSSSARALSERFALLHVDTGSFYRAVTFKLLEAGVVPDDESAVAGAMRRLKLGTRVNGRSAKMEIDGWTPGEEIRSAAVNDNVSRFAAMPSVRKFLLDYQRGQADVARAHGFHGLVMEGRDIGSIIFPDADLRFFLQASPEARALRRAAEGHDDKIHERDKLDTQRKAAPLVCPAGAIAIDSTSLSLEQVVEKMSESVSAKMR